MSRYRAVYDDKGLAYEVENGEYLYIREDLKGPAVVSDSAPTIQGDLPDFVSPIDGSVVHGRAGLRDHCARHNVVPTVDLEGLPPKPMNGLKPTTPEERNECRRLIAAIIDSNVDLRNTDWDK